MAAASSPTFSSWGPMEPSLADMGRQWGGILAARSLFATPLISLLIEVSVIEHAASSRMGTSTIAKSLHLMWSLRKNHRCPSVLGGRVRCVCTKARPAPFTTQTNHVGSNSMAWVRRESFSAEIRVSVSHMTCLLAKRTDLKSFVHPSTLALPVNALTLLRVLRRFVVVASSSEL